MWVSVEGVEREQVWAWVLLSFGCVLRGTRHYWLEPVKRFGYVQAQWTV